MRRILRENLSSVNPSDEAASTVASSTGGFENAEVDDSTVVDLTTFGNVDPYSARDETAGSFSMPSSSTMLEPLSGLEVHAAAMSTCLQSSQSAIKRPASPDFGNDEMYGSFNNCAFMTEPIYHS